jgi:hypothetical protein
MIIESTYILASGTLERITGKGSMGLGMLKPGKPELHNMIFSQSLFSYVTSGVVV